MSPFGNSKGFNLIGNFVLAEGERIINSGISYLESSRYSRLGQFTRNYTQTVKRAADNKRRYAPGWVHSTCLLRGFPKGAAPHLAHDFAEQSVVCYTLCRRCCENAVAAGEGKHILSSRKIGLCLRGVEPQAQVRFQQQTGRI